MYINGRSIHEAYLNKAGIYNDYVVQIAEIKQSGSGLIPTMKDIVSTID